MLLAAMVRSKKTVRYLTAEPRERALTTVKFAVRRAFLDDGQGAVPCRLIGSLQIGTMEEFMRHHLSAGALAAALVIMSGSAVAQNTPSSGATTGQPSAQPGQQSTQAGPHLNAAQGHEVTQGLSGQQAQAKPPGFDGQVGSKVPDSMQAQKMPDNVTSQVPQTSGYLFVKLPDRVLLIDPDNKTVIELVAEEDSRTGSLPGNSGGSSNEGDQNQNRQRR
jgi:hypothetical protein